MAFSDEPTNIVAAKPPSIIEKLDDTIALRKGDRISVRIVEDRDKTLRLSLNKMERSMTKPTRLTVGLDRSHVKDRF